MVGMGGPYRRSMATTAVLWDIDGTLIRSNGVGAASFERAIESVLGAPVAARVAMAGKTDPQIALEWLVALEVAEPHRLVSAVLSELEAELSRSVSELRRLGQVLPGIPAILRRLSGRDDVVQSTCTGNIEPNAKTKLGAFGLERYVDVRLGAFGSDHADRDRLVAISIERMRQMRQVVPDTVWVVGDTPRDLRCARAAGARCLLVATGGYDTEQLRGLGADAVMEDLSDVEAVTELLAG